jgi:hypothetical protein
VTETRTPTIDRRPRRVLAVGIVVAAIALAAIVWLMWPSPSGPLELHSGTPRHIVTVTIDSPRLGNTVIDIIVTDRTGNPINQATVQVQAIEPLMGYAGQPGMSVATGPGHYRTTAIPLMMTGPWQLRLSIDARDGIDQLTLPLWVGG